MKFYTALERVFLSWGIRMVKKIRQNWAKSVAAPRHLFTAKTLLNPYWYH